MRWWVLPVLVLCLAAGVAWGMRWSYQDVVTGGLHRSIRMHRWTGETQIWRVDRWEPAALSDEDVRRAVERGDGVVSPAR